VRKSLANVRVPPARFFAGAAGNFIRVGLWRSSKASAREADQAAIAAYEVTRQAATPSGVCTTVASEPCPCATSNLMPPVLLIRELHTSAL
jgi:hypothetical protein